MKKDKEEKVKNFFCHIYVSKIISDDDDNNDEGGRGGGGDGSDDGDDGGRGGGGGGGGCDNHQLCNAFDVDFGAFSTNQPKKSNQKVCSFFFRMLSNVARIVNVANCAGTSTYNYVLTYTTLSLTQHDITTSQLGLEPSCPCFPNICYSSLLPSHYECGSATLFDLQTESSPNKTIQTYHFALCSIT